ncbi:dihydrodipicolinate synthase family protein [Alsobacter sp. R-9]
MTALSGVFPVLPTPFTEAGAVDPDALRPLVEFVVSSGADGLVYPGMASEVETLSPEERLTMVKSVGAALAGRLPMIVGASDADPARAAARAEEGRVVGARAAMIMAPNRCGADIDAHVAFYAAVAAGTSLPIMLQNAPAPMGAGLSPEQVAEIVRRVPAIRFVKEETLPCGQHVTALLASVGDRLDGVFGGAGARYLMDELARGAAGTMPATELTDVHVAIVRAHRAGDAATARRLYSRTLPLLMFQAVFRVRLTKAVLAARGLMASRFARAAGPRFDDGDEAECAALIAEAADLFTRHPVRT